MTYLHYPDRTVVSPDGRLRLEVRSPANQRGHVRYGFGHEREFHYRLLEVATGRVLWERDQEEREGSPVEPLVASDGLVVVRAHGGSWGDDSLLCFDREGLMRLGVAVGYGPAASAERGEGKLARWLDPHVIQSTVGPLWTQASITCFAVSEGRALFWWRTWWGRRLVIDLKAMTLLDDSEISALSVPIATHEREVAIDALRSATAGVGSGDERFALDERRVLGALLASAEHGLVEAIPYARQLEHLPGLSSAPCQALGSGWAYRLRQRRAIAQRTLHALGAERAAGSNVELLREVSMGKHEPASRHGLVVADVGAVGELRVGADPRDVLARVGCPDWITREPRPKPEWFAEVWEYDDGDRTIRVTWSAPADGSRAAFERARVVERVEAIGSAVLGEDRLREAVGL